MTKKHLLLIISLCLLSTSFSQRKSKLNTNVEGTLFASFGVNRSFYSAADVLLDGNTYTASLSAVQIADLPGLPSLGSTGTPQWNAQLGYFVAEKWAIIGGLDRYNTYFRQDQRVALTGSFAPQAHSNYSGTYQDEAIDLSLTDFNLVQQGLSFISIGLLRMDQLYKTRKNTFSFNTLLGAKLGPILGTVDYTFDGSTRRDVSSLSGFGFAGIVGVRLDFFQHLYLEALVTGGYLNQHDVLLSNNGSETAEQRVAFISPQVNLGISLFVRPKNGCGTCPNW
jgi:hypothetical protein